MHNWQLSGYYVPQLNVPPHNKGYFKVCKGENPNFLIKCRKCEKNNHAWFLHNVISIYH